VLAIGQRVHGVNDNRLDALARPPPEHVVHDRHDVGKALPRASAGRQDVRSAAPSHANRLGLVPVQVQLSADRVGLVLVATEDAPALGVEGSLLDEPVDRPPGLECRVQLDERVGPEQAVGQVLVHEATDARIGDVEKAARVLGVVLDQPLAKPSALPRFGSTLEPPGRQDCRLRETLTVILAGLGRARAPVLGRGAA